MKLLAIETSSTACSLALCEDDKDYFFHKIAPMQQTQLVLPSIQNLLVEAGFTLNDLEAIAFGCGPGSFTGVRIATSVAQGLGFALEIPLIPISSLAGLVQAAYDDLKWDKILVATDARVQEVYWGAYEVNKEGLVELVGEEKVTKPEEVKLPDLNWCGVGNGWKVYENQFVFTPKQCDSSREPSALGVLKLAKQAFLNAQFIKPEEAVPTYLRNEVAKKSTSGSS